MIPKIVYTPRAVHAGVQISCSMRHVVLSDSTKYSRPCHIWKVIFSFILWPKGFLGDRPSWNRL